MPVILDIKPYLFQGHLMTEIAFMVMSHIKTKFFYRTVKFILFN